MTEFSLPLRVYIEDTDAGGIVYYVNYLKYFERARTEFMRSRGFSKAAFFDEQSMFVVSEVAVRYRRPAQLDDPLRVTACVVSATGATVVFEQKIYRSTELLVEGMVTIALVDRHSGRPRRLPSVLQDSLRCGSVLNSEE
jgi:tol-pal system-associated acyl-CoA thioesterase